MRTVLSVENKMKFGFDLEEVIIVDSQGFAKVQGKDLSPMPNSRSFGQGTQQRAQKLSAVVDFIGAASSKAQGLSSVITSFSRMYSSDNRLYMRVERDTVLGFIKVGEKNLFHREYSGKTRELKLLCVLDFFVHESVQRGGVGKSLFEEMTRRENVRPEKLAIDRPSHKFLSFLKKHYGLSQFVPQVNNFVIFDKCFQTPEESEPFRIEEDKRSRISQAGLSIVSSPYLMHSKDSITSNLPRFSSLQSIAFKENLAARNSRRELLGGFGFRNDDNDRKVR